MQVYIGADHGGYEVKQILIPVVEKAGYTVSDCGPLTLDPTDDYPAIAQRVAGKVIETPNSKGVLICRSGEGMAIVANKVPGIRASVIWNTQVAQETRNDNDANIAVLPADYLDQASLTECVLTFLRTPFSNEERHIRRLQMLHAMESYTYKEVSL